MSRSYNPTPRQPDGSLIRQWDSQTKNHSSQSFAEEKVIIAIVNFHIFLWCCDPVNDYKNVLSVLYADFRNNSNTFNIKKLLKGRIWRFLGQLHLLNDDALAEPFSRYNCPSLWCLLTKFMDGMGGFMVLNATFNNISAILWRSVLLVEETGVPGENHRPATSHW